MKRSGKTGKARGKAAASRRRKTAARPPRAVAKRRPQRARGDAALRGQLDRKTRELNEALEQQAASSEVLRIISSSPGELEPVFQAILENATRICQAQFGTLNLYDGSAYRTVALHNPPPQFAFRLGVVMHPHPESGLAHVARTTQIAHIEDIRTHQPYLDGNKAVVDLADLAGARTLLIVPMLNAGKLVGAISIYRQEIRPFTGKQIELLSNFAAQAVIAIENARLLNDLRESLDRQTATSEVLKVISSSSGELQPVFKALLANATRLCGAKFGNLHLAEGEGFRAVATHNVPAAFAEARKSEPAVYRPEPGGLLYRLAKTKAPVVIADASLEPGYVDRSNKRLVTAVDLGGFRSNLAVPMLKDGVLVGGIIIYRQEAGDFSTKQIELVQNFAAQAVIAIENTRLLSELRQRTDDLTEALEQQTATSEVLKVISSSPGELDPVFQAMLENATRICEAKFGTLYLSAGNGFQAVATHNAPPGYAEARARVVHPHPDTTLSRAAQAKQVVQIADVTKERAYVERDPFVVSAVARGGYRSVLSVPMLKEGDLVGVISIFRQEVRPFSDKQIALVQNFAAQAVIAIENTRLLNELRQRTDDLTEALEQQTATSEVLGVISSSPGELEPVFQAMLANAVRICDAKFGTLFRYDNEAFNPVAEFGAPPALAEFHRQRGSFQPPAGGPLDRLLRTKDVVRIADDMAAPVSGASAKFAGARSLIVVPMLKEDVLIGAITIYRQEVRPFTDKQVELVRNFAAQAVIAIENTRLLSELRVSLEQQTATADVLSVINVSRGDLQPVFEAMVEKARRLCEADAGHLALPVGGDYRSVAVSAMSPEMEVVIRSVSYAPGRGTAVGRALEERRPVQISDIGADNEHAARHAADKGFIRTILGVPLLREGEAIGAFGLSRQRVEPFSERQIELVRTFADQAVIAIENTRLLNELRQSLEQQTATSDVLRVISSSSGELEPVFQAMLENATRICDANIGILFRYEDGAYSAVSLLGVSPAYAEYLNRGPIRAAPATGLGRVAGTKQTVHIADTRAEQAYTDRDPFQIATAELGGARSLLNVPMLKDGELIGAIGIYRREVQPFTDKQVELVTSFAAQAVIAIENTRLLNELRKRTVELERSYGTVRQQASQLETQSQELRALNQQLEERVAAQVNEIERMGRLRRFLPPQVADLIVSSGTEKQLESHRREIAALFCDLRGFTGFSESSDPEDVMTLLREYHSAIGRIIFEYGGTLERFAGDGVMVIFNDPVPVENPALQAVRMALDLRKAIMAMIEKWRRLGHDLGFGIGIADGYATLGTIGFEGRFDYAAIGMVSNVASRLCDEAQPGQILISTRVLLAVEGAIAVEPAGEFTLKGIRRPMTAHNVVATIQV